MTKPKILSRIFFFKNEDDLDLPQSRYPTEEDYLVRLEVTLLDKKDDNTADFATSLEKWLIKNKSDTINFVRNPETLNHYPENYDFFAIYINNLDSLRNVIVKNFEKYDFELDGIRKRRLPNTNGVASGESLYEGGKYFCNRLGLDTRTR